MAEGVEVSWGKLATLAAGVVALAAVARGVVALGRAALGEVRYRANDPDVVLKWLR